MTHRTALITAGSIAAVVFAGAIAVGANLGILSFADSRPVGKLSASTPFPTKVVREYVGAPTSTAAPSTQKYVIKKAGAVQVSFSKTAVRVVAVSARPHWKWALAQSANKRLTVTFRSGSTTYTFVATLAHDGSVVARVDQPVTRTVSSAPAARWVAAPASVTRVVKPAPAPTPAGGGSESHDGGEADD